MSVLHQCSNPRCDNEWETGLGVDPDDLCRDCQRVNDIIARGGRGLASRERAAVAAFLGAELGENDTPFFVDGGMHGIVWGEGDGAFKAYDAVEPVNAFSPSMVADVAGIMPPAEFEARLEALVREARDGGIHPNRSRGALKSARGDISPDDFEWPAIEPELEIQRSKRRFGKCH